MKKNNTLLIILLVISILISISLGGYLFYDKVLNKQTNYPNEQPTNQNDIKESISKINPTKDWIYDADYPKNVLANSYDSYYNETYYAKDIIAPFININSNDAKNANNTIEDIFNEAVNRYNIGVEDKTTFSVIDYEKYIDNNLISVLFWFGKGGTDVVRPDYYTYTFDLQTGKALSFKEVYQKFNFNQNQIDNEIKQEITDEINDIFEESFPNENAKNYIDESIKNYEESINNNTLKYYISEDSNLSIVARLNIPAGAGYKDTIIEID